MCRSASEVLIPSKCRVYRQGISYLEPGVEDKAQVLSDQESFLHPSGMRSESEDVRRSSPNVVDPTWGKHLALVLQVATVLSLSTRRTVGRAPSW